MESSSGFTGAGALKPRIKGIEITIKECNNDLNNSKKEIQNLRSEFSTIEHRLIEQNNETMKELLEDLGNLEKDLKKLQ